MFKQELKRLLKSKATLIIIVLILLSAGEFLISHFEKQELVGQLNSEFAEDLNIEALTYLIENYTGVKFMFNYWFNNDFGHVAMIVLFIWAGIFLSPSLIARKETGLGNLIVSRKKYSKFALTVLGAQTVYVYIIIAAATVLQFLVAQIWGGFDTTGLIGPYDLNFGQILLVTLFQIVIISLYGSFSVIISTLCETFIKNKYALQILPFVAFYAVPLLIRNTLGNIIPMVVTITDYFMPYGVPCLISRILNNMDEFSTIITRGTVPVVIMAIIFAVLFAINVKQNSRDYI